MADDDKAKAEKLAAAKKRVKPALPLSPLLSSPLPDPNADRLSMYA
jgi:hypothetical protein